MSASRALFSVTSSPACGATRNRITRGPASPTVNRTRAVAAEPSSGQLHLLRADDSALVFDIDVDGLAGVAGLR